MSRLEKEAAEKQAFEYQTKRGNRRGASVRAQALVPELFPAKGYSFRQYCIVHLAYVVIGVAIGLLAAWRMKT